MKILFPFVGDSVGGSHISTLELYSSLIDENITTLIVLHEDNSPLSQYLRNKNIPFSILKSSKLAGETSGKLSIIIGIMTNFFHFSKFIKRHKIDIVHGNDLRINLSWSLPAKFVAKGFVWHQRTLLSNSKLWLLIRYLCDYFVAISDVVMQSAPRNIEDANGKTIWVPLSGGLDSRLIVCKLKQLGCDNFRTYSYGVAGNFDAIRAREIASTLNIQWDFFPTTAKEARKYFLSEKRKEYWDFADGLSVVPNLHGMFALKSLVDLGKIKPGDVVINGQSGDFIAGQHIPIIKDHKADDKMLLDCILRKHYRLRKEMLGNSEFVELVNTRIKKSLGKYQYVTNYQDFAKSYEYWEWKERQVKRVVNGQCNYNYFGLKWELPLWDLEYLQFWIDLPLHQKVDRRLFIEYLNKMDFYGLFKGNNKFMSRWPLDRVYIQFIGNIISKIFGKNISNLYYKKLDRYSQYQYMYGLIGGREYKHHWRDYKGVYPYLTDIWLNENIKRN